MTRGNFQHQAVRGLSTNSDAHAHAKIGANYSCVVHPLPPEALTHLGFPEYVSRPFVRAEIVSAARGRSAWREP